MINRRTEVLRRIAAEQKKGNDVDFLKAELMQLNGKLSQEAQKEFKAYLKTDTKNKSSTTYNLRISSILARAQADEAKYGKVLPGQIDYETIRLAEMNATVALSHIVSPKTNFGDEVLQFIRSIENSINPNFPDINANKSIRMIVQSCSPRATAGSEALDYMYYQGINALKLDNEENRIYYSNCIRIANYIFRKTEIKTADCNRKVYMSESISSAFKPQHNNITNYAPRTYSTHHVGHK